MDKVNINLSAIFHHSGGYSELARNLAEVLSDLGVLAHIDSRGVEGNFHPMPVASYASQKFMKIHASLLDRKSFYDQPNIVMQFVPPFMMAPPKELLSIGVTMFETRVPEGWYKQLDNV